MISISDYDSAIELNLLLKKNNFSTVTDCSLMYIFKGNVSKSWSPNDAIYIGHSINEVFAFVDGYEKGKGESDEA